MRFDIYGRFKLDIERMNNAWIVYRVDDGKRRPDPNIVIPATITEHGIIEYLDDLLHEFARPEKAIRRI